MIIRFNNYHFIFLFEGLVINQVLLVAASSSIYWKNFFGASRAGKRRKSSLNDALKDSPRTVLNSTIIAISKGKNTSDDKTNSEENPLESMRRMIEKLKGKIKIQNIEIDKQNEHLERQFKAIRKDIDRIKDPK